MRIVVGGAIGRYYEPDHVGSILRLLRRPEVARYAPRFNDAAVDRARSQCATEFLEGDADVLLQIDSDIVFDPSAAIAICEQAMTHDVVGGLYVTRATGAYSKPTSYLEDERRYAFASDPTPVPVRYLAGGFTAIHRRVYEALATTLPLLNAGEANGHFYPFFLPMWMQGEAGLLYLSEDWAMCHRAREAGFGVWLNPSIRLLHLGQYAYHLEDIVTPQSPYGQFVALTRHAGGLYERETQAPTGAAPVPFPTHPANREARRLALRDHAAPRRDRGVAAALGSATLRSVN